MINEWNEERAKGNKFVGEVQQEEFFYDGQRKKNIWNPYEQQYELWETSETQDTRFNLKVHSSTSRTELRGMLDQIREGKGDYARWDLADEQKHIKPIVERLNVLQKEETGRSLPGYVIKDLIATPEERLMDIKSTYGDDINADFVRGLTKRQLKVFGVADKEEFIEYSKSRGLLR